MGVASLWDRFHGKIEPEPNSGCWLWVGAVNQFGYGIITRGTRADGLSPAHRVSYELYKGQIPDGLHILHKCDVPGCVNPDHLWAGTQSDNMQDCVKKGRGRHLHGERHPHAKLTVEKVAHIRQQAMTGAAYAKLYGVSKANASRIKNGIGWRGV